MPRGSRATDSDQLTVNDPRSTAVTVCVQAEVTMAIFSFLSMATPQASLATATRPSSTSVPSGAS